MSPFYLVTELKLCFSLYKWGTFLWFLGGVFVNNAVIISFLWFLSFLLYYVITATLALRLGRAKYY